MSANWRAGLARWMPVAATANSNQATEEGSPAQQGLGVDVPDRLTDGLVREAMSQHSLSREVTADDQQEGNGEAAHRDEEQGLAAVAREQQSKAVEQHRDGGQDDRQLRDVLPEGDDLDCPVTVADLDEGGVEVRRQLAGHFGVGLLDVGGDNDDGVDQGESDRLGGVAPGPKSWPWSCSTESRKISWKASESTTVRVTNSIKGRIETASGEPT